MTETFVPKEFQSMLQATPLVSVIISNYNYGCYIAQAIESVLAQTYQNFELIVVDDGSKDNSREVIDFYKGCLTVIFQTNAGQGEAFNTGIAQSQGEIICFLDADDYFHPDKLAKVVAAFIAHPQWVQIAHCWTSVDKDGVTTNSTLKALSQGNVRELLLRRGKYAWGPTSGLSYRREALLKVLPIPARPRAADTYLTATVPFYGEIGSIQEALMYYRLHGDNRRAHSDNIAYLIEQREDTTACINQAAANIGIGDRFDIQQDVDYRSLKALQLGGGTWVEALQILWLSLQESFVIRRSWSDTLNRLLQRGICTLYPIEGKAILRLGLRGYLRLKLSRQEPNKYIGKRVKVKG